MIDQDDPYHAAIKRDDSFVATFVSAPAANWILRRVAHLSVSPNQVTSLSVLLGALAAALFATGQPTPLVVGAVLLQLSFVLDCLDGQLARYRGVSSSFGAWFDLLSDRLQEVLLFAGITFGCLARGEGTSAVAWSYAALFVVFYKHFDLMILPRVLGRGYEELLGKPLRDRDADDKARVVAEARSEARKTPFGRLLDTLAPKGTVERRPIVYWTKKAVMFDGAERYLLISILAALQHPEWICPIITIWGGAVYPLVSIRRWSLFGGRS